MECSVSIYGHLVTARIFLVNTDRPTTGRAIDLCIQRSTEVYRGLWTSQNKTLTFTNYTDLQNLHVRPADCTNCTDRQNLHQLHGPAEPVILRSSRRCSVQPSGPSPRYLAAATRSARHRGIISDPLSPPPRQRTKDALDVEGGVARRGSVFAFISRVFFEAFTLTFLAEWGDRSQIATILLAAREVCVERGRGGGGCRAPPGPGTEGVGGGAWRFTVQIYKASSRLALIRLSVIRVCFLVSVSSNVKNRGHK